MAQYKDYYKTLGVNRDADKKEIKRAFRRLARQHHPDVNPGDKQAEERFKEINEAYEVLSDPDKRAEYDRLDSALDLGTSTSPGGIETTPFVGTQGRAWNPFGNIWRGGPLGGFFRTESRTTKQAEAPPLRDVPPRRNINHKITSIYIPEAFRDLVYAIDLVCNEGKNNLIVVRYSDKLFNLGNRRFTYPIWRVSRSDAGIVRVYWAPGLFESSSNPETHELSQRFVWNDVNGVATKVFCSSYYEDLQEYIRHLIRLIIEKDLGIKEDQDFLRRFESYHDIIKATGQFGVDQYCRLDEFPDSLRDISMHFIEEESKRLVLRDRDYAFLLFLMFLRSHDINKNVRYVLVMDEMGALRGSRFVPICQFYRGNLTLNEGIGTDSRLYRQVMRTLADSIYDGTGVNPKIITALTFMARTAYKKGDDPFLFDFQEEGLYDALREDIRRRCSHDRTDYYFPFYIAELRRGIGPEGINRHNLEIVKCKEKERVHIDPERGF